MRSELREHLWEEASDQEEPVFHVKWEGGEFAGGWQAFADWVVIWRPSVIRITAEGITEPEEL